MISSVKEEAQKNAVTILCVLRFPRVGGQDILIAPLQKRFLNPAAEQCGNRFEIFDPRSRLESVQPALKTGKIRR